MNNGVALYKQCFIQRAFHMATAWCRDSGIFAKMLSDSRATTQQGAWVGKQADETLGIWHLAPSFLLVASGLILSIMTFCTEITLRRCKKKTLLTTNHHEIQGPFM